MMIDVGQIKALQGFHSLVEVKVRWGDMDAFDHVNNTIYFRYFEEGRIDYFRHLGFSLDDGGDFGPILADTRCKFRAPVTYPDTLIVATRIAELGEQRAIFEHLVYSSTLTTIAARGSAEMVWYDYKKLRKASMDRTLVAKIEQLEERSFDF